IESAANKYTFVWRGSIEKFREKLYKKITKQINILNERYLLTDIYFEVHETYEIDYLASIKACLESEIEKDSTNFKYGKSKKKKIQKSLNMIKDKKKHH